MKKPKRSISAKEVKRLTGKETLVRAICDITDRMKRRSWKLGEKSLEWSGINWERDTVLFFWAESTWDNCVAYSYFTTSIADAIDCISGRLNPQEVTRRA